VDADADAVFKSINGALIFRLVMRGEKAGALRHTLADLLLR
jgi:hypothetical protein